MTNPSNVKHQSNPAMEIGYRSRKPTSLGSQLSSFAARRIISKAVDVGAKHLEDKLTTKPTKPHRNQSNIKGKRNLDMFTKENTAPAATTTSKEDREPVRFWVNNMVVMTEGAEPVQIGMGRPLDTYKTDAPVNTQNEDFNARNAISNVFVRGMQAHAATLEPEHGKILGQPNEDGTYPVGTYIQVYRSKTDFSADAAAKADKEAVIETDFAAAFG